MARRVTGFRCEQKTTGYSYVCNEVARFLVGVPGERAWESSCAQHLAKAVLAQTARHGTTGAVVKPLPYKETTEPKAAA